MNNLVHLHKQNPALANKIIVDENNCWLWQGFVMANGYPYYGGKRVHRIIWKILIGNLSQKDALHHKCKTKSCVNPDHLEKMSFAQHNIIHQKGNKMNLSEQEIQRRKEHGRNMIKYAQEKSYSKRTRQDVAKEMWNKRTSEERAEIGRKISATKRGDA